MVEAVHGLKQTLTNLSKNPRLRKLIRESELFRTDSSKRTGADGTDRKILDISLSWDINAVPGLIQHPDAGTPKNRMTIAENINQKDFVLRENLPDGQVGHIISGFFHKPHNRAP